VGVGAVRVAADEGVGKLRGHGARDVIDDTEEGLGCHVHEDAVRAAGEYRALFLAGLASLEDGHASRARAVPQAVGRAHRDHPLPASRQCEGVFDRPPRDIGMGVARLRVPPLPAGEREPVRMRLEVAFGIEAVPGVADRDGDGTAHPIPALPGLEILRALRIRAIPVPDLPLEGEAGRLAQVPCAADRRLPGDNLPCLAGEEPATAEAREECRDSALDAEGFVSHEEEAPGIALRDESLAAEFRDALEWIPREVRGEPHVDPRHPPAAFRDAELSPRDPFQAVSEIVDRFADAPRDDGKYRAAVRAQGDGFGRLRRPRMRDESQDDGRTDGGHHRSPVSVEGLDRFTTL